MNKQDFINAGFTVVGEEQKENKLIAFLKEHYPSIIKDKEINLQELKAVASLPVDEKVNGYGLNFVGRNVARAKYAQKTEKELRLNTKMSKNIDTTQNLVLKGDNLDCLKILKNYYSGKIKCIYIDPPYNTDSDEFIYPDKFDKEEAEVLGLVNLSEEDFARMEFAFKTKKSHNGWLAFIYPRLLLARDLLSDDGVIFISIDDNEQANLKLLMDEIFGEENFITKFVWHNNVKGRQMDLYIKNTYESILFYAKNKKYIKISNSVKYVDTKKLEKDEISYYKKDYPLHNGTADFHINNRPNLAYSIYYNPLTQEIIVFDEKIKKDEKFYIGEPCKEGRELLAKGWFRIIPKYNEQYQVQRVWRWGKNKLLKNYKTELLFVQENDGYYIYQKKRYFDAQHITKPKNYINLDSGQGKKELKKLLGINVFENPKPTSLIIELLKTIEGKSFFVLDFFAGSGTTGHAVMQLNAEDGGNRKFILVQIDEPIKEDKPAHKFCVENNLPPVISSITIERLRRAGEKIKKEIEEANSKEGLFEENKKKIPDIGFKVFDTVDAPKLKVDNDGTIQFPNLDSDAISRIYNMIFTVGLDEPTQVPEEVVKDCVYRIGDNYYITNSEKVSTEQFAEFIKNGNVFVDGWTASLNTTLQYYKENVKIVF